MVMLVNLFMVFDEDVLCVFVLSVKVVSVFVSKLVMKGVCVVCDVSVGVGWR